MLNQRYVLKLKDVPLLSFIITTNQFGEYSVQEEQLLTSNKQLLPKGLQHGLTSWLTSRVIPKNRQHVKDILGVLGLTWHPLTIITVSNALSLTDAYWVCPEDSYLQFSSVNLFENDFSEVLGHIAFTGYRRSVGNFRTSPELSTDGMLPKCWRREGEGVFLYKGGTSGAANSGLEPYSEYYAYQVASKMGLHAVPYDLKQYKGKLVSTCPLFTSLDSYYVPMHLLTQQRSITEIRDIYGHQAFSDLVAFDFIIANTDRHLGNFGMLQDSQGHLVASAPIFDNGLGLFPYLMQDDFEKGAEHSMYANVSSLTDNIHVLVKGVVTQETKRKVRKLIHFKFYRHSAYNLPVWRLKALEQFIQQRVTYLLTM